MSEGSEKENLRYHYAIAYSYQGGIGRIFVWTSQKIDTEKVWKETEETIKRDIGLPNIFISHVTLLEGDTRQ